MRVAYFSTWFVALLLLTGCQSTTTVVDTYKMLQQGNWGLSTVSVSCEAGQSCDFARVDNIAVIDERTQRPTQKAIEQGLVRLQGSVFSKNHQYSLSLIPGQHEIVIRFYPVSSERLERFHVIHKFMAEHNYKFVMYRQKLPSNGSLLNVAMPGPLCVDLLQDGIVMRRFCKPFDVMTGLGEFVEQQI